ncbi:hypothetical protein OAN24_01630 [Pseudodesulfovibrio sp.]|nr:hypothetical protein [Pseudodesulfovibrio sp.]
MNLGFMQELATRKQQGETLGGSDDLSQDSPGLRLSQGLNVDPAHAGLAPAAEALMKVPGQLDKLPEDFPQQPQDGPLTLGATFANEIVRRMEEADQGTAGDDGQPKDNSDLRHSLGQTLDWMREKFGDEAASAAAGMVLQSTSSGVNEESLGDGLLNTLKFIDRNFGFAAGDEAIARFNQSVNPAINDYFDNGKAEVFYATPAQPLDGPSATQEISSRMFMRAAQSSATEVADAESITEKLLADLKKELDEVAELQDLTSQLEAEFSPAKATPQSALAAYTAPPVPAEPQFTDVRV